MILSKIWIIGIFILCVMVLATPVSAGLKVVNAKLMQDIAPGETIHHTVQISISSDDPAADMMVDVMGFGQTSSFTYTSLKPADDTSPYSAREFIKVDKPNFTLQPGTTESVTATVAIPTNVGPGGRYAIIYIHSAPSVTGSAGFITAIEVPVLLTIKEKGSIYAGEIRSVEVGEVTSGKPMTVTTTFTNTGNIHYYNSVNSIEIANSSGGIIYEKSSPVSSFAIVPTSTGQFKLPIQAALPVGTYTLISRVSLKDTVLAEKTIQFEVKKAYIPPFEEFSSSVYAQTAKILSSSDGTLSLSFPQGAVLDETTITVRPIQTTTLSSAPSGTRLGFTGFEVEGITGLLLKEVTISIKYHAEDLEAANGDPTKLFLARWDKADSKWILVSTKVDGNSGTLTVTTTRLSTWAVMVSEGVMPTEVGVEGTQTPGFTAGIVCGALALLFIANRWRKR
jgi:hypothetical protein